MKQTVQTLQAMKERGEKIAMLTCYDYTMAKLMDAAGTDMLLVGDSLGNVILGYSDTISVTMEDMIHHTAAVSRGAQNALVVADMPFLSYQTSVYDAVVNAGRLMKEGRAGAVKLEGGKLVCEKMKLGDPDDKGRRQPVPTGEMVEIPCDTVVSAVGEKVESEVFTRNGITVDEKGIPAFKTNLEGVYAGGDAMRGPATVVEGIADAQYFANAVIGEAHKFAIPAKAVATREEAVAKKGVLCESAKCEGDRCLTCNVVCQVCADVCPNRANVVIELPDGRQQILHVDRMCNECGNCAVFCPYDSAPYREKFTLFLTREGFDESVNNQGFLPLGGKKVLVRLDSKVFEADLDAKNDLPADIEVFIWTVLTKYAYLMG